MLKVYFKVLTSPIDNSDGDSESGLSIRRARERSTPNAARWRERYRFRLTGLFVRCRTRASVDRMVLRSCGGRCNVSTVVRRVAGTASSRSHRLYFTLLSYVGDAMLDPCAGSETRVVTYHADRDKESTLTAHVESTTRRFTKRAKTNRLSDQRLIVVRGQSAEKSSLGVTSRIPSPFAAPISLSSKARPNRTNWVFSVTPGTERAMSRR